MPNTITRGKDGKWFFWRCDMDNCNQYMRYLNKIAMRIGSEGHREYHRTANMEVVDDEHL